MSNYLIKLIPTGKFFFGGDMTFSVGAKERPKNWNSKPEEEKERIRQQIDDNTRYSSYIIKSEKFPQQTSLLGMLRFLLLRNDSSLFDGYKIIGEVKDLIGEKSFTSNGGNRNNYGKIQDLSPCFLMNGDNIITRLPMDYGLETIDLSAGNLLSYNNNPINLSKIVSGKKDNGDEIKYSAKDGLSIRYGYVSKKENGEDIVTIYDDSEIFIEDQRIGISRNIATGKTEDNALYKQVSYRLADDFCFAFYAKINIDDIKPFNNQVVLLGADSSQFVIQIKEEEIRDISLPETNVSVKGSFCKVVLTSPTLIDKETAKIADFAITETIPFKCMQTMQTSTETTKKTDNYDRVKGGIAYSERYELYQTGSVFYFSTSDRFESFQKHFIDKENKENPRAGKDADFHQIGYNHFQVIDLTTNK